MNMPVIQRVSSAVRKLLVEFTPEIVAACDEVSGDVTFLPASPQGCSPESTGPQDRSPDALRHNLGVRPAMLDPIWPEVPIFYALSRAKCKLIPMVDRARNR